MRPTTLLPQIDHWYQSTLVPGNGQGKKRGNSRNQLSRKDARKQDRSDKKRRKAEFFSAPPKSNINSAKRPAAEEHVDSPQRKKIKLSEPIPAPPLVRAGPNPASKKTVVKISPDAAIPKPKKPKSALERLASRKDAGSLPRPSRSQKEREDDAYIRFLESKVGKGKKSAEDDDGLDGKTSFLLIAWMYLSDCFADLLDFTSSIMPSMPTVCLSSCRSISFICSSRVAQETDSELSEGESGESGSDEESCAEKLSDGEEWGGLGGDVGDEADVDDEAPTLLPAPPEAPTNDTPVPGNRLISKSQNEVPLLICLPRIPIRPPSPPEPHRIRRRRLRVDGEAETAAQRLSQSVCAHIRAATFFPCADSRPG